MDRLTYRGEWHDGVVPNGFGTSKIISNKELLDRLAAYEDTGYMPQDLQTEIDELNRYRDLGTVEHYAELVKAESEGRIAECTCGECKYRFDISYEPGGIGCKKTLARVIKSHSCSMALAERREGK
jgi:hypothetical protein